MEAGLFTFLLAFFASAFCSSLLCNTTTVDESDPITLQLAQLDAIKCQIAAASKQHTETLSAIEGIRRLLPRQTNLYDVLIYLFSSLFGIVIVQQVVKCVYYYLRLTNDNLAIMCILCRRLISLEMNFRDPTPGEIEEYRKQLSPPVSAYLCICCCKGRPRATARADVDELI